MVHRRFHLKKWRDFDPRFASCDTFFLANRVTKRIYNLMEKTRVRAEAFRKARAAAQISDQSRLVQVFCPRDESRLRARDSV
jgi:hypothetical protein